MRPKGGVAYEAAVGSTATEMMDQGSRLISREVNPFATGVGSIVEHDGLVCRWAPAATIWCYMGDIVRNAMLSNHLHIRDTDLRESLS